MAEFENCPTSIMIMMMTMTSTTTMLMAAFGPTYQGRMGTIHERRK
jgi:hypothetical protein